MKLTHQKGQTKRADVGDIDSAKEVLIGNTNRTESQQVLSKIQGVGYALSVMQNKVVVVATHDVFLSDAVSAFVEKYIQGKPKTEPSL